MRKLAFLLVVLVLSLAACGGGEEGPGSADPGQRATSPPPEPAVCPLTAMPAPSGLDHDRPALSVKIENAPESRPQAGLQEADVVYEQLAEGGITRFNAIYHCSDAGQLGPIRSARSVDPEVLVEYQPVLFAYAGAAPTVQAKVAATEGITDLSHGKQGGAYRRERGRRAPHNLFSSTDQLRSVPDAQDVRGAPETGLVFESTQPGSTPTADATTSPTAGATGSPGGVAPPPAPPGNEVSFTFGGRSPSRYTYEAASGAYLRFHGADPHRTVGGGQIKATNVLVFKVQIRPGTIRDAAGNLSPEIAVIGSGEAVVLTGGKSVAGKWNRSSLSDKTTITDAAGAPVRLKPGNTWIHLIPSTQPVTLK